jgi:hypothetical protein
MADGLAPSTRTTIHGLIQISSKGLVKAEPYHFDTVCSSLPPFTIATKSLQKVKVLQKAYKMETEKADVFRVFFTFQ